MKPNREQNQNPGSGLQMAPPIFQPRPRHQLRPPSMGLFDDFHPLANNRMYFPSAPSMTIPPPLLNDFLTSFPVGAGPSYGMLPYPPQDLAKHHYLPSMDFGYGFPGAAFFPPARPPPLSLQSAFMPSRQQDSRRQHDAPLNTQYRAHMAALQSRVDSFMHSFPADGTEKSASKNSFGDGSSSSVADSSSAASHLDFDTFKLKSTPVISTSLKLHSGGHQLPSSQSSFRSPPSSSHFTGMPLPPLHLPVFKPSVLSSPQQAQADKNEPRRNFRDSKAHVNSSSSQLCVVEDASNDEPAGVKIPKLPPLLIGNKDLARKLSEEEQSTRRFTVSRSPSGAADSGIRKPEHDTPGQHGTHVRKTGQSEIAESSDGVISSGSWVEDMVAGVVGREPCCAPSLVSSDMSDIEVMREAYGFRNFHRQQHQLSPISSGSIASVVSKHSGAFDLTSTPLPGPAAKRRRQSSPAPSGMLPFARPNFQTFPYLVPHRKEAFNQFSDSGCLPGFGSSEQQTTSHPMSVSGVPSVNTVASSLDQLRTERNKLPSGIDTTDCGDAGNPSGTIHIKQEVNDEVLDFTVSSNVNQSFETPEVTDRDLLSLGSREAGNSSEIPSQDCSSSRWMPDAVGAADEGNGLDEDGFLMPLVDSLMDLSYASAKSCQDAAGASANGMGDERTGGEFRCHLCNYSGRSQHCLTKHFRAHSQACKICRYCMKAFERPSDLVRHEERHQKRNHVVLKKSSNVPAPRPADYLSKRTSKKKRRAWFCQQCDFSCHEARKLIVHTRKMHPIHFECKLCRMRFTSEAGLAEHRTARHPVALGRMDTYWNGVVTATKLVTCEVTNDQEISISFDEILELPLGTDGIPEVSNIHEARHILNKNGHDKEDSLVNDCVVLSPEGSVNCLQRESSLTIPLNESASIEEESPLNMCHDSLVVDSHADVLDLSSTSFSYSLPKDKTELASEKTLNESSAFNNLTEIIEPSQNQSSAVNYPEPEDMCTVEGLALPLTSRQTSVSDNDSFEASASGDHVEKNRSPTLPALTETNSVENLKESGRKRPVALAKKSTNSRYKPAKLAGKVPAKKFPKDRTNFIEKIKIVSDNIKVETVENCVADEPVLPALVSDATTGLSGADKIAPNDSVAKSEATSFPDAADETDVKHDKTADVIDSLNRKCFTFICVRCKYSTNSKFKYQQHLKAHNGRYICKRCNKACIKSSDLYRHWVTHNVKGPNGHFACDSCDFTSPQKYVIENHMKQHYMLNPAQPRHQLSLMSRCGICQKNVLRSRLFEHKRVVHGTFFTKPRNDDGGEMDANGNSIKVPPKTFACPQCDRRFTTPSYLLRHHFLHHQEESDPGARAKAEKGSACSCRFCGLKFDDVDLLQEHEIGHIVQTCSDVDYAQRCRKRKRHRPGSAKTDVAPAVAVGRDAPKPSKKRSPRRKLSCPHCGKHFKMQYFLDQHLRVHGDERPFVCQWCGAGFAIFQYLNIHRRFKCPNRTAEAPAAALDARKDCSGNSETNEQASCSDEQLPSQTCN